MKLARRVAAAGCTLALALGGVIALAPAASATPHACFSYVLDNKPDADKLLVQDACEVGAAGGEEAFRACYRILRDDYVPAVIAANGCRQAPQE
ncbi:hypothetical protein VM98_08425 [Streptomyces rubellomurinus subsp. indigoferus]|uniref:Secreted protein n=1 Tax=Streptomyces rubellomurinus (strain ATCC 31215) TaxID=359131 RepID=A0A0F2TDY7_STRR3|nr:hypothetical protein [Streptomyces rubellomurinus]KJS56192.1 hypothetical protein VM98_08425 [Streptomyces rubellomurinus subsp. indigoferus]KJS60510.1 hypothetical protein VM95_20865 [Streptomyces rubellomurinus]